ncbi:hypothetical protein CC80DRAFT_493449 [Byssothecium circinans]|uniref:Zn(2)-C6 fungal-type domain-containing protein n=1 Tax=Byssothecium circinans TaxID=147558 RepID=A0A6A5TQZ5_9PLEO|nr:hypothetical protein CC80DRAFT_493449 [Byssothecium circinans]
MGPKRPSGGDLNLPHQPIKLPKIEQPGSIGVAQSPPLSTPQLLQRAPNSDFSGSVKKKLANSSRTGQACDRCKVRKIRCDPRPEGCSPCAQNRTPCKTTDRITGRATTRGHAEAMEGENAYLRAQIADLQAQLKEMGVEPRATPYDNIAPPPHTSQWANTNAGNDWGEESQRRESISPMPSYAPASGLENNRPLPQFKHASFGDNYLGVSSADSLLSNIKGTSLSVFGHEIDITDFIDDDQYENSTMSYNHFIRIAMNEQLVDPVPLPEYHELSEYCKIYLRSLNPYVMLVDKRELMNLVWCIGNDPHFKPTAAQTVCIHMVLATLKHQISVRNGQSSIHEANRHYTYALSFYKDLLLSHTWQDVQALALISQHLRNFPKPGAAWYMMSTTFTLAIELGFHRSHKAWADSGGKMDKLEIEMRKRIFWVMHALGTNLSGKLGRPMPINLDEVDVEFPEPVDDTLPGEDVNGTPFRKCSFQIGIQIAKFTVCLSKLYGQLYSLNRTASSYNETIRRLDAGLRQWKEEQPWELQDPARATRDDFVFSLFLEYWYHEYILLLHHPAVCRSRDPEVVNANMDRCLAASQKMLHTCNELRKLRSLDIPWINAVVYIAAMFTTLFIYFQRRDQMFAVDMNKLRGDMDQWVDVMGDWGQLLGSGDKLKNAIHSIVERSLSSINEAIFKRTASQSLAQVALQGPPETPAPPVYSNGNHQSQYPNLTNASSEPGIPPPSQPYPAGATYAYNNGTTNSAPQPSPSGYEQHSYPSNQDPAMAPSHAAALQAATSSAAAPPPRPEDSYAYANTQVATNGHQHTYPVNGVSPEDWIHFTRTYMHQQAPQGEYLNTATTLMALGGREGATQGNGNEGTSEGSVNVMQGQAPAQSAMQWPGVQFGMPSNGHVA